MLLNLYKLNYLLLALLSGIFTWFITLLGASGVFLVKRQNRKVLDCMLGFAGGVMFSASFFSLILPSIEYSKNLSIPLWFPLSSGFILGVLFLLIIDRVVPHLHLNFKKEESEGIKKEIPVYVLLILAITIHNIPEGLAIGISSGSLKQFTDYESFIAVISLVFGIGIQNFPEGLAISLPLSASGISKSKSFWYGQLSGIVEPIFAVLGAFLVSVFSKILPYALSFAAGAMIYVVVEEVIPETQRAGNTDIATLSFLSGFLIMMVLDTSLL